MAALTANPTTKSPMRSLRKAAEDRETYVNRVDTLREESFHDSESDSVLSRDSPSGGDVPVRSHGCGRGHKTWPPLQRMTLRTSAAIARTVMYKGPVAGECPLRPQA